MTGEELEVRRRIVKTFRRDMERGHPWIPGAAFNASPGLAAHVCAALEAWRDGFPPAGAPTTHDECLHHCECPTHYHEDEI